jgi:MFS family permease
VIEGVIENFRGRYGWVMVAVAALTLGMGFGTQVSISVFIKPLGDEFGWPRGDISLAYTLAAYCSGFSGIFMGYLADRMATRIIVVFGSVVLGLTYFMLGFVEARWQLYILYGPFIGGMCQGAFLAPLLTNVGFWFDRHKGLALGLTLAGQSLGAALVPLVTRVLISEFGWRYAYHAMGIGILCLLVPMALLIRQPPALAALRDGKAAGGPVKAVEPLIRPGVLAALLCPAIVCCCICMAIPIIHVVPLATDRGIDAPTAAAVLTLMMIVSIVGRVGIGKLADAIGGPRALFLASATQTALIFWFTRAGTPAGFYLVAVLFAVGYGGVIPAYAIIIRELVPPGRVGRLTGTVMFFGNIGMGTGGFLGGALYDWSGSYTLSFGTGAVAGMVNLAIVGSLLAYLRSRQPLLAPVRAAGTVGIG